MKISYKNSELPLAAQKHTRIFAIHRFIDASSIGMFGVILILLLQDRGFSLFEISVLFAVFSGTSLVLELPLGGLADGIGRKPVYMMSVVAFILSVFFLIISDNYWVNVFALVLMGIRTALMSGTLMAWFVEKFRRLAPDFGTQPILARSKFASAMGIGISSVLGGFIADLFGSNFGQFGLSKYEIPLVISFIIGFIILVFTHFLIVEEGHKLNREALKKGFSNLGAIIRDSSVYGFKNKIILTMLIGSVCTVIAFFTFQSFWVPFVKPMLVTEYATSIIGVLTFVYFASQAVGTTIANPVIRVLKNDMGKALAYLVLACTACLFAISTVDNIFAFVVLLVLYTMFVGSVASPYGSIFHDNIPDDKRSTMLSLVSLSERFGGLFGLLFIGYIGEEYSLATAFKISAIFIFAAGLIYLTLSKHIKNISNH